MLSLPERNKILLIHVSVLRFKNMCNIIEQIKILNVDDFILLQF